jgi:hypothetical protein
MERNAPRDLRSYINPLTAPKTPNGANSGITRICPDATAATARHINTEDLAFFLPGCKRWKCPVCGPERKAELCRRLVDACPDRFLTLTCKYEPHETPREVYDRTRRLIPKLFAKLNKGRRKAEYFRMLELHKSGYPHYHFLIRGPFWPRDEVKLVWERLTGSFIVNIQGIKPNDRSRHRYAIKYVTKAIEAEAITNRPWTASRNFWKKDEFETPWHRWGFNNRDGWRTATDELLETSSLLPRAKRSWWVIDEPNVLPRPPVFDWEAEQRNFDEDETPF